jgi:hypothetical protein
MQYHLHYPVILRYDDITGPHIGETERELPAESRINKTSTKKNAPPAK